jgi:dephospho-CoA kinase
MIKAAITGNIGSGKTTVCAIFESLGIPVFYADAEAKKLYTRPDVRAEVQKHFGSAVFDDRQQLIRQKLAALVFSSPEALQRINQIIHPRLMQAYQSWLVEQAAKPYTLHEAAVIFENGLENHFDMVINVSCPEKIRIERIACRDHLPIKEIQSRMHRQWSDEKKNKLADRVILNDRKHFLIPQVMKIHHALIKQQKK